MNSKSALRFKDDHGNEFPRWEQRELNKVASKVMKKNTDLKIQGVLTNSATEGIVRQEDYFDKDVANPKNIGGYYVVDTDDFVYNPRISKYAPVGPVKRNKLQPGVMSPLYTVFRFKEGNLEFLEQFFNTTVWHDYMRGVANYGVRHDRMNISGQDLFALPIPMPSIEEQKKIASFLSAIDEKIENLEHQLEALKDFKLGIIDRLFASADASRASERASERANKS